MNDWPQKKLSFESDSAEDEENRKPHNNLTQKSNFNIFKSDYNPKNLSFDDSSDNSLTKSTSPTKTVSSSSFLKLDQLRNTKTVINSRNSSLKSNSKSHYRSNSTVFSQNNSIEESSRIFKFEMKTRSGKSCSNRVNKLSNSAGESNSNSNSTPPLSPRIQSLIIDGSPTKNTVNHHKPATPRTINHKLTNYVKQQSLSINESLPNGFSNGLSSLSYTDHPTTPELRRKSTTGPEMMTPTSSIKINVNSSSSSSKKFQMKSKSLFGNSKSKLKLPTSLVRTHEESEQFYTPRETPLLCLDNEMDTDDDLETMMIESRFPNPETQNPGILGSQDSRCPFSSQDFGSQGGPGSQFGSQPFGQKVNTDPFRIHFSEHSEAETPEIQSFKLYRPEHKITVNELPETEDSELEEPVSPISSIHSQNDNVSPVKSYRESTLTHQLKKMKTTSIVNKGQPAHQKVSFSTPQRPIGLPKTPLRKHLSANRVPLSVNRQFSANRLQNRENIMYKTPGSIGAMNNSNFNNSKMLNSSVSMLTPNRMGASFNNTVNVNIFSPAPVLRSQHHFEKRTPPSDANGSLRLMYANNMLDASGDPNNNGKSHSAVRNTQPSLINSAFNNGSRLEEEFVILDTLGKGEFGCVLTAQNRLDGIYYAVKHSNNPLHGKREEMCAVREVMAHAALSHHKHIVKYFSAWCENNRLIIQNEYCNGKSVKEYLNHLKHLPVIKADQYFNTSMALEFMYQVLKGVKYIHANGLVHLDIKPENIFICYPSHLAAVAAGHPNADRLIIQHQTMQLTPETLKHETNIDNVPIYKIGDFGHVFKVNGTTDQITDNLKEPLDEGDVRYLAKELLDDDYQHLTKADVFAVGISVHELWTRLEPPKNGDVWHDYRNNNIPYPAEKIDLINSCKDAGFLRKTIQDLVRPDPRVRPSSIDVINRLRMRYNHALCKGKKRRGRFSTSPVDSKLTGMGGYAQAKRSKTMDCLSASIESFTDNKMEKSCNSCKLLQDMLKAKDEEIASLKRQLEIQNQSEPF